MSVNKESGKCYTYMLRCSDNSLYTGWTSDLEAREKAHNEGKTGAKCLRGRRPVKVVYFEEFDTKSEAMRREAEIKKLKKEKKENLIKNFFTKDGK